MFRAILIAVMMFALIAPAMAEEAAPAAKADEAAPAAKAADAAPAAKADEAKPAPAPMDMSKMGPMTRRVKKVKKLRREIAKFLKAEDAAMKKHDLAASMALVDFPVTMITDDAKGEGAGDLMTKEAFEAMMKPFYDMPMPKGMKLSRKNAITPFSPSLSGRLGRNTLVGPSAVTREARPRRSSIAGWEPYRRRQEGFASMRNCPFRSMAGGAWKSTCLTRTRAWQSNWTVLVGKTVHTGDMFAARDNWPGSLEVRGVCRLTPNGIQRSLTAFHTTVGPEGQGVRMG